MSKERELTAQQTKERKSAVNLSFAMIISALTRCRFPDVNRNVFQSLGIVFQDLLSGYRNNVQERIQERKEKQKVNAHEIIPRSFFFSLSFPITFS